MSNGIYARAENGCYVVEFLIFGTFKDKVMGNIELQYLGDLRVSCKHAVSGAKIEVEAPKEIGGGGNLFSPTDLVGACLASCMLMVMAIAAKKIGVDLSGASAEVEKIMEVAPARKIGKLIVRIRCPHLPSEQDREKLEKAALQCPVHASLHPAIKQEIDFVWGI